MTDNPSDRLHDALYELEDMSRALLELKSRLASLDADRYLQGIKDGVRLDIKKPP